jgi:hypothetical protein
LEFRRKILGEYGGIFGTGEDSNSDGDDFAGLSKKEIIELKKIDEQDKRFRWYSYIYLLADGDITKFKDIMDLSFILTLNHISYKKIIKQKDEGKSKGY